LGVHFRARRGEKRAGAETHGFTIETGKVGDPMNELEHSESDVTRAAKVSKADSLAQLWNAYDNELREAGVLMFAFGAWRRRVSQDEEPCSIEGAIDALEDDIKIARRHDESHDERLLREWLHRLREGAPDQANSWHGVSPRSDDHKRNICPPVTGTDTRSHTKKSTS